MPDQFGTVVVALDFDGSLVEAHTQPLRWRAGAKEFILGAAGAGVKLWLFSCRNTPACILLHPAPMDVEEFWRSGRVQDDVEYSWSLFAEMRAFLELEGVWALLEPWTRPGKPIADVYADDLSEPPDWYRLAGEIGIPLVHAEQRGHTALGTPIPGPTASPVGDVVASANVVSAVAVPAGPGAPAAATGNDLGP